MDDNLVMKVVFFGTAFSLLILAIAYFFISPQESEFFTADKMEKIAEFTDTRVTGRKDGHKAWTMQAAAGWTDKNREVTYLEKITDGKVYREERLVVTDLTAPRAKVYRRNESIETTAYEGTPVKAYIHLGRLANPNDKSRKEWTHLTADSLKYSPQDKRTDMLGNITLVKKDSTIKTESITIDNQAEIADFLDPVTILRRDGVIKTDSLQYVSKDEKMIAKGNVSLRVKEKKLETRLTADQAVFFAEMNKEVSLEGKVNLTQGKKLAVAERGIYSKKQKNLDLQGNVHAVFAKGRDIIQPETAEQLRNDEAKESLREKTVLTADKMILSTATGDTKAYGSVKVTQKGREAEADAAIYDDKKEIITLSGNVSMKKIDKWVKAKKVIVSVKNETFEAIGQVEAEIKI